MLAELTTILTSLALGAGILERFLEAITYLSNLRLCFSLANERENVYYITNAA